MDLPEKFVKMLSGLPGYENTAEALATTEPSVAVRFNPLKTVVNLTGRDVVPWEPLGLYLDKRPQFTFDTDIYSGFYYVQDPSSMIVGQAVHRIVDRLGTDRPLLYLDACAAPGGKTTSAIANLPEGSFVLANEYDPSRADALVENLERWGYTRYAVSRGDARRLAAVGEVFDIVSTDVPCSGEGMMRKNETAVTQWSDKLIENCAALQRDIVSTLWHTLRPGGYLIYSTCTFNTSENEKNALYLRDTLGAIPVDLGLDKYPGVLPSIAEYGIPGARFVPGRVRGEGLFIAVFQKPGDLTETHESRLAQPRKTVALPPWLSGDYIGIPSPTGDIFAVKRDIAPVVNHLCSKAKIIVPGIHVATQKGHDLIPAQALATTTALSADAFPIVEVDYPTAVAYLRGEALRLDSDIPKGFVILAHEGARLGFAKNIGSRLNNLFPPKSRIRSSHAPAEKPRILD